MCVVSMLPLLHSVRGEADRQKIVGVPFTVAGFPWLHSFSELLYRMVSNLYLYALLFVGEVVGGRQHVQAGIRSPDISI